MIIEQLKAWADIMKKSKDNKGLTYCEQMLRDAKKVEVVRAVDVLEPYQVEIIKRFNPKIKECYKNAHELSMLISGMTYCEGKVNAPFMIDHAFNKYTAKDGKEYYIDATFEFALKDDPRKYEYVVIGEYDEETLIRVTLETQYYGGIYDALYIENMKKPVA